MDQEAMHAHVDVWPAALIEVLSIGRGDLTLTVGGSDEDRERAKRMIGDMLRAGYAIFVETDEGPRKVEAFDPNRMTYIVREETPSGTPPEGQAAAKPKRARKTATRKVPVASSRATAVGRTAGG